MKSQSRLRQSISMFAGPGMGLIRCGSGVLRRFGGADEIKLKIKISSSLGATRRHSPQLEIPTSRLGSYMDRTTLELVALTACQFTAFAVGHSIAVAVFAAITCAIGIMTICGRQDEMLSM